MIHKVFRDPLAHLHLLRFHLCRFFLHPLLINSMARVIFHISLLHQLKMKTIKEVTHWTITTITTTASVASVMQDQKFLRLHLQGEVNLPNFLLIQQIRWNIRCSSSNNCNSNYNNSISISNIHIHILIHRIHKKRLTLITLVQVSSDVSGWQLWLFVAEEEIRCRCCCERRKRMRKEWEEEMTLKRNQRTKG